MGNATSSVAEIKKKGDEFNKAVRRQRALAGLPAGLAQKMSSKRFKKEDPSVEQWKIFNDLDVQDDKLMIDLAIFLNRLVKQFPSRRGSLKDAKALPTVGEEVPAISQESGAAAGSGSGDYFEAGNTEGDGDGDEDEGLNVGSISVEASRPVPPLLRIGSVNVTLGEGDEENLMDYSLPKVTPSMATVEEVMQLFESGGKLSVKTVRKILRDAYKILKELTNINRVPLNPEDSVTVVGDLHGQLADLVHLLNHNGLPSRTNKYIFNGDFVDRGFQGVEVLLLLFLLITVCPESVFLNRGNHEDFGLCCVYGFQKECLNKYNDVVFSMFCEMFRHLPVCSVIHDKVLVIHGGLFHRQGVTLADIEQVERLDYVVPARSDEEAYDELETLNGPERREKDLRTIMHCALWSDPDLSPSLPHPQHNPRGAGVLFGPDSTESFLEENGLDMVVRSHECVEEGFDLPFEDDMEESCATIFSASNYGGSMNQGATMRFSWKKTNDSYVAGGERGLEPKLFFTVYDYQLSSAAGGGLLKANQQGLSSLVLRKKKALIAAFTQVDKDETGYVTKGRWCQVMENVTGIHVSWLAMSDIIVDKEDMDDDKINWRAFMSKFHVKLSARAKDVGNNVAMFDAMYADREKLETIFRFFDTDGNGTISREEFHKGCELINQQAGDGEYLENLDVILDVMDMDNNDSIDINEFFEVFRLVDAADGCVDGKYGVPES